MCLLCVCQFELEKTNAVHQELTSAMQTTAAARAAFDSELNAVLDRLDAAASGEGSASLGSWINKPEGWKGRPEEWSRPDGKLVTLLAYSFEVVSYMSTALRDLLRQNSEADERAQEDLVVRLAEASGDEADRLKEAAAMERNDPQVRGVEGAAGRATVGSHLVPLSRLEALTRVEGRFKSNNGAVSSLDRAFDVSAVEPSVPPRKSIHQYKDADEIAVALAAMHSSIRQNASSLNAVLARKDMHYRGVKSELAEQLVERRRREEEVVNWSYILKYLLASSAKLRKQMQREKKVQAALGAFQKAAPSSTTPGIKSQSANSRAQTESPSAASEGSASVDRRQFGSALGGLFGNITSANGAGGESIADGLTGLGEGSDTDDVSGEENTDEETPRTTAVGQPATAEPLTARPPLFSSTSADSARLSAVNLQMNGPPQSSPRRPGDGFSSSDHMSEVTMSPFDHPPRGRPQAQQSQAQQSHSSYQRNNLTQQQPQPQLPKSGLPPKNSGDYYAYDSRTRDVPLPAQSFAAPSSSTAAPRVGGRSLDRAPSDIPPDKSSQASTSRTAPSAFAQEVVRTLGVEEEQAAAAMSIVDQVQRISPHELLSLDAETRAQILQIKRDLRMDTLLDARPPGSSSVSSSGSSKLTAGRSGVAVPVFRSESPSVSANGVVRSGAGSTVTSNGKIVRSISTPRIRLNGEASARSQQQTPSVSSRSTSNGRAAAPSPATPFMELPRSRHGSPSMQQQQQYRPADALAQQSYRQQQDSSTAQQRPSSARAPTPTSQSPRLSSASRPPLQQQHFDNAWNGSNLSGNGKGASREEYSPSVQRGTTRQQQQQQQLFSSDYGNPSWEMSPQQSPLLPRQHHPLPYSPHPSLVQQPRLRSVSGDDLSSLTSSGSSRYYAAVPQPQALHQQVSGSRQQQLYMQQQQQYRQQQYQLQKEQQYQQQKHISQLQHGRSYPQQQQQYVHDRSGNSNGRVNNNGGPPDRHQPYEEEYGEEDEDDDYSQLDYVDV